MKKKVIVLSSITCLIVLWLTGLYVTKIVPILEEHWAEMNAELARPQMLLVSLAHFLQKNFIFVTAVFVMLLGFLFKFLRTFK